jgi:uncharacterized iron-regulated membrane protein
LIAAARGQTDAVPVSLTLDRDPSASAAVAFEGRTVYVDPYTGSVLGEGSARAQAFFRTMVAWHRYIGMTGEQRPTARSITGASNLAFLALAVSGIYLWWPRTWSAQHTRPILAFRRAATGRARDFNWHNVIGFWCAPLIIVMTVTASVISYPWATNLLYRAMGSTPPSSERGPAPAAPRPDGAGQPGPGSRAGRTGPPNREARAERAPVLAAGDIDRAWSRAETLMPAWRVMTVRMPNRAEMPVSFTISDMRSWNAFARSTLTVDAATGDVRQWQPYDGNNLGQKARGWFRFAHTGELGGLIGQILAGIGCAGGVVLVWTGLSLALRRLFNWRIWRRAAVEQPAARRPDAA